MTTYIELGGGGAGGGSPYYGDPVADFASLPVSGEVGEIRITMDTGRLYHWTGAIWDMVDTEVATIAAADTDSVNISLSSNPAAVLTCDVRLSADAAQAGFYKSTLSIKSGGSPGLHVETELAATAQTGILTSTDWNTFNNKEPAITVGTATQYWRGDKTFQELVVGAITAETGGNAAAAGDIGEIIEDTQALTTTGVGATTAWGNAASVVLTAGKWELTGLLLANPNGANLAGTIAGGISTANNTSPGSFDYVEMPFLYSNDTDIRISLVPVLINIAAGATYYLNTRFTYDSGTPQHGGRLTARRVP